jgi:hypothetical protein
MAVEIRLALSLPKRRPKVDRRTLARAIADLQVAEGMALHAHRDGCLIHALQAAAVRHVCAAVIPRHLLHDREWVHQHIEAPGVRIQARTEDRWREEA